ncbi:hypothetical protein [Aeoliella mucimassa]|uniref:Secreted protein n=1 Tax=Aeoliella mucimassa TaxID=2527972 RepID=A0A518AWE3_9BACT|nr:hypothetical protein [Aeoliella mucimassa]QDU59020.1 hypothetical protein Pan181_52610 [Aeoliella mucimassa]
MPAPNPLLWSVCCVLALLSSTAAAVEPTVQLPAPPSTQPPATLQLTPPANASDVQPNEAATPTPKPAPSSASDHISASDRMLANSLAAIVREAIPREYEKKKDWGSTKHITTGITTDEPLYKLKLHRKKTEVSHGTWKQYRVKFIDPDEQLSVSVENLHSLESAGLGLRLLVEAKLEGWAQMRRYERGIHIITLTAEGDSRLKLAIDCEVRMRATPQGMAIDPKVTNAQLELQRFNLTRFGELHGKLAEEFGDGLEYLLKDQLENKKLTAKLNRAIDKKRDRLVLLPFTTAKPQADDAKTGDNTAGDNTAGDNTAGDNIAGDNTAGNHTAAPSTSKTAAQPSARK